VTRCERQNPGEASAFGLFVITKALEHIGEWEIDRTR
jgi:hypothetical protein